MKLIRRGYDGKTKAQIRRHEFIKWKWRWISRIRMMFGLSSKGYFDCAFLDEYAIEDQDTAIWKN